jgi:hypothetical protein
MNRKPDSSAPSTSIAVSRECQIVEADGLIRKLTDRDYYLPESRRWYARLPRMHPTIRSCSIYIGTIWVHESRHLISVCELCALAGSKLIWTALVAARQDLPEQAETMLYCNVQVVDVNEIARIPPQRDIRKAQC